MNSISTRLGGICASLFAILFAIGIVMASNIPDGETDDAEYTKWVNDDGKLVGNIVGGYLMIVAALLLLVFVVAMYKRLRTAEGGDGTLSLLFALTGTLFAVMIMTGAIGFTIIPLAIKFGDTPVLPAPETSRWLPQLGYGFVLIAGGLAAALMSLILGVLITRTKTLPAWLGYLGFLAALAMIGAVIFIPMVVFVLWMLVMGVVLAMKADAPAMAAA